MNEDVDGVGKCVGEAILSKEESSTKRGRRCDNRRREGGDEGYEGVEDGQVEAVDQCENGGIVVCFRKHRILLFQTHSRQPQVRGIGRRGK